MSHLPPVEDTAAAGYPQVLSASDAGSICVAPGLARWARWRTGDQGGPLDALQVGDGKPTPFIPQQVLVDRLDTDLVAFLVDRHGAEVLPPARLPPPPDGLRPRQGVRAEDMPLPVRLRLRMRPPVSARALAMLRARHDAPVAVSSARAAALVGLVAELARGDAPIGLDIVGHGSTLPLLSASEMLATSPFNIPAYTKNARVCAAWQLVEAFRQVRTTKPVTIAILDGGFWLNGRTPGISPQDTGSDLGTSVDQLNLLDEDVGAGGANPSKCGGAYTCDWHGNEVASIAAARVDNRRGAAGVGGTVARPVLLKTDLSTFQIIRGVQVCLHWGIDVLNMSFTTEIDAEIWFPTKAWNNAFQFAANNGLIMIAAAGNDGERVPDKHVRPATRTPGTITVGWLDANNAAHRNSNFGPSVDVWAPGEGIPVMPDPANQAGSSPAGTSIAAPFVSGIAAMMRAVNPSIDNTRTREILVETGWPGTGGTVTVGVDAFAAVLKAMGGGLPSEETVPNDSPATAGRLRMISGGRLVPYPLGRSFALLSHGTDQDWYRFDVDEFSQFDLQMNWYELLGGVSVTLEPDDPSSQAQGELAETSVAGSTRLSGLLAPGGYKLHVRGSTNLYELSVGLKPAPLGPDMFERNDSFETATRFRIADPPRGDGISAVTDAHGPGSFNLTLPTAHDRDFFRIEIGPRANPLNVVVVRVARADAPLDVVLFDSTRTPLSSRLTGVRAGHLTLPSAASPFFFVEVSAKAQTRYTLTIRFEVDQAHVPGPHQKGGVIFEPDLGDPAFRVDRDMNHILFEVDETRRAAGNLTLRSVDGRPIRADLLDSTGAFVTAAVPAGETIHHAVELRVGDLLSGTYVLRLGHGRASKTAATGPLDVEVLPASHRAQ